MLEIKITAATASELVDKLNGLLEIFSGATKPAGAAADTTAKPAGAAADTTAKPNPLKPVKKEEVKSEATSSTEEIAFEDVRSLASLKSNADVKTLFTKYSIDRLSALDKAKYPEFMADLNKFKNK